MEDITIFGNVPPPLRSLPMQKPSILGGVYIECPSGGAINDIHELMNIINSNVKGGDCPRFSNMVY